MNPYDSGARKTPPNPYAIFYKVEQELEAAKILRDVPALKLEEDDRGTERTYR